MNNSLSKVCPHILIFIFGIILLVVLFLKGNIFHTDQFSMNLLVDQTNQSNDNEIKTIALIDLEPVTFTVFHDQSFWVAGQKKLIHFSQQGDKLEELTVQQPFNALTAHNDKMFFGATDKQIIQIVFENDHWEQKIFATLDNNNPFITSLCISEGQLYVADSGNKKVHAFNLQGEHLWSITGKDKFIVPSPYFDVASDSYGGVWVVNPGMHRIENYDKNGNFKAFWEPEKKSRFLGCCNPAQLAVLAGNRFVTLEKGIIQCRIFSPSGRMEKLVASNYQLLNHKILPDNKMVSKKFKYELALKNDGSIVILDIDQKILLVFETAKQKNDNKKEN